MNIWLTVLLFILGIILTVKGGDWFVDAASWIAEVFGIPKFVVGATIVSLATTLPEMLVSTLAAGQGKVDMAIGNAVGSVTANTAMILALALMFMPIVFHRRASWRQSALLIAAAAVLWLASLTGTFALWGSVALLLIFALYIWENLRNARSASNNTETRTVATKKEKLENGLKFLVGAAAIVGGSQLLVNSGSDLAAYFGVPERVIALTLVAIGTSLPELVTTITAIVKKQSSLSVGNIIGANTIDLTLILPLCAVINGGTLPVSAQSVAIDLPVCLAVLLIALIPLLWRERGSKVQGGLLLAAYVGYMVMVL